MTSCIYCGHRDEPTHRVQAYSFQGKEAVNLCAPNSECRCYWKFKNKVANEAERDEPPKRKLNGKPRPNYRETLSRAAESARVEHILRPILNRGPLLRGTPEWDERERARAAVGCGCLSFGAL